MGLIEWLLGSTTALYLSQPAAGPDHGSHPSWYAKPDGNPVRFAGADGGFPGVHLIEYRDSSGEVVLRLCEDSTGLLVGPTDRRLPPVGILVSQLRGERYHKKAGRRGDFSPGRPVRLVREPQNPHDKNAVAVYALGGEDRAAYVNKQKARMLSKLMDSGRPLSAISIRGTPAGVTCDQIAILAAAPGVIQHLLSPRSQGLPPPAHLQ